VSRECGWVAKLPSDELKSSKGLVEGGIQSVLATNPVVIQLRGTVGRAAAPGWREFGQAESECGKSDADIRLSTPIKCCVTTPYAIVLKGSPMPAGESKELASDRAAPIRESA